jgi:SAM-dependent methyltransferase
MFRFDLPPNEWVEEGRVRFLQTVLPKGGVGAELGVYKGHFTPILLDVVQPRKLHLVDPWYLLGSDWGWGGGDRSTMRSLTTLMRRLEKPLVDGRLVLHIGSDLQILPTFGRGYFDWVYIDSSHAYAHTRQELRLAADAVKPDGLICGDDWRDDPSHPHYGVRQAVEEFVAEGRYEQVYAQSKDRQWAIRRR